MYQVTVFAIRGERGIVSSSVEYINTLVDDVLVTTTTTVATTGTVSETESQVLILGGFIVTNR